MEGNKGRLNGLPDDLLMEILSKLPLDSAIATSVLARRWRWLWTHLTDIDIKITNPNTVGKEPFLVPNVLPKLTSPFIRSLRLHLRYAGFKNYELDKAEEKYNSDNVISWYDWASRHKNHLRKLSVLLIPNGQIMDPDPPLWFFQIPSLEILELTPAWFIRENNLDKYRNSSFNLPNLKQVSVNFYNQDPWILEKLVSCSPSLQVLTCSIMSSTTNNDNPIIFNFSSRNLKRLSMELFNPIHVVINAPKLENLHFHTIKSSYDTCFKISFVNPPTALRTCTISPWTDHQGRDILLPSNLFTVISGVRSLTTADQNPSPLISPITFRSLTRLEFKVRRDLNALDSLEGLALLQQCPALEVLTLDLSEYLQPSTKHNWSLPDSVPQCLATHVKRIEILACPVVPGLEDILLQLLNYLLGNAEVLELLKITIKTPPHYLGGDSSASYDEIHLIKEVFKVPTSSPHSQVEFYSPDRKVLGQQGLKMMLDSIRDDSLMVGKDDLTNERNEGLSRRKEILCKDLILQSEGSKEGRAVMDQVYPSASEGIQNNTRTCKREAQNKMQNKAHEVKLSYADILRKINYNGQRSW